MAYNVNFLKGTLEAYRQLATKDVNTFYYVDGKDLYLGEIKLTNAEDLNEAINRISTNEIDIATLKARVDSLAGGGTGGGSSNEELTTAVNMLEARVGSVEGNLQKEIDRATAAEGQLSTNLENLISRVNDLSTTVESNKTSTDTQLGDLTTRITEAEGTINKHDAAINSVMAKVSANEGKILGLEGSVQELDGILDTLVGADTDKSVRAIAIEVLVEQLLADGNTENFETLQQLAAWLADHPEEAAEMNLAIQQNSAAISSIQDSVNKNTATIESLQERLNSLSSEDGGLLSQAKEYTDSQIQTVNNALNEYKTITDKKLDSFTSNIRTNTEAIAAINNPSTGILAQAQVKINEFANTLGTAAYKNVEDFDAAGSAAAALTQANEYTDRALSWGVIA